MQHVMAPALEAWEPFYIIVGPSGAALTGLQFVVIALIADTRRRSTGREIDAFATPSIVHFCAVLVVSAILSAPWPTLSNVALLIGAGGLLGVGYTALVTLRVRRQTGYRPVFEDWLWHTGLPLVAYATMLGSALFLVRHPERALAFIAATSLLLLLVGIHNAWDTVTFIVIDRPGQVDEPVMSGDGKAPATPERAPAAPPAAVSAE